MKNIRALMAGLAIAFSCAFDAALAQTLNTSTTLRVQVEDLDAVVMPGFQAYWIDELGTHRMDVLPDGTLEANNVPMKVGLLVQDPVGGPVRFELELPDSPYVEARVRLDQTGDAKVMTRSVGRAEYLGGVTGDVALPGPAGVGNASPRGVPGVLFGGLSILGDDCRNPIAISGSGIFPYSNLFATTDGAANAACTFLGSSQILNDVWYCWTADCTGTATLTNCGLSLGDSKVAVYDGCGCPATMGNLLACSDDECGILGNKAFLQFDAVAGQQYLIRIGDSPDAFLPGTLGAFLIVCDAVVNDECEGAIPITVPTIVDGSTTGASIDDASAPSCPGGSITSPGVWYSLIGDGSEIGLSTCAFGTNYDTKLSVYCGECDDLTCITANDDIGGFCGVTSAVSFCSQPGIEYKVLVHGWGGQSGDFELLVTSLGPCFSPVVDCVERVGACCLGEVCRVREAGDCQDAGGFFQGDRTDCCGTGVYDLEPSMTAFESIAPTGTDLGLTSLDDSATDVPIGFVFDFFGEGRTTINVASHGYASFNADDLIDFIPNPIPDLFDPNDLIAPYWDDYDLSFAGAVYAETLGEPGARRFVLEWNGVVETFTMNPPRTFQLILDEATGCVEFVYEMIPANAAGIGIGLENALGTHGYSIDSTTVAAGQAYRFCPRMGSTCPCEPLYLGDEDKVDFSTLDGSDYDLDRAQNGKVELCGLYMEGNSWIDFDCYDAHLTVRGDVVMCGQARLFDEYLCDYGPDVELEICGDLVMSQLASIRADGLLHGGSIDVCVRGSIRMEDITQIRANGDEDGGEITLQARRDFEMADDFTQITANGRNGGTIDIDTCGGAPDSLSVKGTIHANGPGPLGVGGTVELRARQGGIRIYGFQRVQAQGGAANGTVDLTAAIGIGPNDPPTTIPPANVDGANPSLEPCRCASVSEEEFEDPVECDLGGGDCNANGIDDLCELDCNVNGIPDDCEALVLMDCNANLIPDLCEVDCNDNDIPDDCEGPGADCNANGVIDECELFCNDFNENLVPDDCD